MRFAGASVLVLLALAACSETSDDGARASGDDRAGQRLEAAAQEAGLIPGRGSIEPVGRYERRSELGTDRACIVGDGDDYKIGVVAVFGPDSYCEAQGTAKLAGEGLSIALERPLNREAGSDAEDGPCRFEAQLDGVEIAFPGRLPRGCSRFCSPRASFSGVSLFIVDDGKDAAREVEGRSLKRLCS